MLTLLATIVVMAAGPTPGHAQRNKSLSVLFIGNSHTFFLPAWFKEFAKAGGHKVIVGDGSVGGLSLAGHAAREETHRLIQERLWDWVVIQESSLVSYRASRRVDEMVPAARELDRRIHERGAQTALYMTWARRDGLGNYNDFDSMQDAITEAYVTLGKELNALVVPVGVVWQEVLKRYPELSLWKDDGNHANDTGAYLTTVVFFASLLDRRPVGLSAPRSLPDATVRLMQEITAQVVLADAERWDFRR